MTEIEMLQQLGLNKYEAEAYYTLLALGPLTGYEVGKRSHVPLSRSYEILERLLEKGLVLQQPGETPRYTAQEPRQFLAEVRTSMETTLEALSAALVQLPHHLADDEFWVMRTQHNILMRARAMVEQAQSSIACSGSIDGDPLFASLLTLAEQRGCRVLRSSLPQDVLRHKHTVLLLCDEQYVLLGSLVPADHCQAVVSSNEALVDATRGYFAHLRSVERDIVSVPLPSSEPQDTTWLDWESRKQRRLWKQSSNHRVA